jgi:hypothetical protein
MIKAFVSFLFLLALFPATSDAAFNRKGIEKGKNANVSKIDSALPDTTFESWLKEVVGPDKKIAWSLTDCGEQSGIKGIDKSRDYPLCAEATVILDGKRKLTVNLIVGSSKNGIDSDPASYLFSVITAPDGGLSWVKKLAELPAAVHKLK